MITYRALIDAVLNRASLESGIDTQVYSDIPVGQIIQSTFDMLFDMYWWPEYYTHGDTSYVLDGTTGATTVNVSSVVKRWVDLRNVWLGTSEYPLPRISINANPTQVRGRCITPDANTLFKVLPNYTNDALIISYRTKPNNFKADNDQILLDTEMMTLGAAYDYINSIGLNPGAEEKLQEKFQNRIATLIKENNYMDVQMGPTGGIPTNWEWY